MSLRFFVPCLLPVAITAGEVSSGATPDAPLPPAVDPGIRACVDRGLEYLCRTQEPDGSWIEKVGRKVHVRYVGHPAPHVGVTAIAGLSFLASLEARDRQAPGSHAAAAEKALRFVLSCQGPDGFISAHGSRMYSHAFATLFLARARASRLAASFPDLEERLGKAVELIVKSQNNLGGWRYLPGAQDADLSVTACQLGALRAARDAGVSVPEQTLERGLGYLKRCYVTITPGGENGMAGAFVYELPSAAVPASRHSFALTACGASALLEAGQGDATEVRRAMDYLERQRQPAANAASRFDHYYGHFYASQAALRRGGNYWDSFYLSTCREIAELQAPDGSWSDLVGSKYATAMATLVLQMPECLEGGRAAAGAEREPGELRK